MTTRNNDRPLYEFRTKRARPTKVGRLWGVRIDDPHVPAPEIGDIVLVTTRPQANGRPKMWYARITEKVGKNCLSIRVEDAEFDCYFRNGEQAYDDGESLADAYAHARWSISDDSAVYVDNILAELDY